MINQICNEMQKVNDELKFKIRTFKFILFKFLIK